jgi:hypothetical protein
VAPTPLSVEEASLPPLQFLNRKLYAMRFSLFFKAIPKKDALAQCTIAVSCT